MKIFVYGTLKRGHGNHRLLENGNSTFIGEGSTPQGYEMWKSGIPFVVRNQESESAVTGEIYEVCEDTLRKLDSLEGHPNWYCRKPVEIQTENGTVPCEIYEYLGNLSGVMRVEDGVF